MTSQNVATKSGFWRSVILVLTGTAAAQAIPLLGSLLLVRLYAPAEFGYFFAWLGIVSLASVFITGRYEAALALEPDGSGRQVGVYATALIVIVSALVLILLIATAFRLLPQLFVGISWVLIVMVMPTAVCIAISQTLQSWAAAEERYGVLARMRLVQSVAITGFQILAGVFMPSGASLAAAQCLGVLVGVVVGVIALPCFQLPRWHDLRSFWSRHRAFPKWSLAGSAVNTAASQLPVFIVSTRFGPEAAGLLALSLRTLGAPVSLLGVAVLDVFKQRAATSFRQRGECRSDYIQTLKVLVWGSTVVTLALFASSEPLFALAFGENWRQSGVIAAWLMPLFALRFIASPLSYMVFIAGRQRVDFYWQIGLLVMSITTLWFPAQFSDSVRWYAAGCSGMYLIYLAMSYRFSQGGYR